MSVFLNIIRQSNKLKLQKCVVPFYGFQNTLPMTTSAVKNAVETFEKKNERLQRPMSPHLTIYKFPLPAILSITHRGTGMVLTGGLYGISIGMLLLPANFPHYFELLQSLHIGSPIIYSLKFALAWSFFYHTFNGVRHLAWDMGYGYDLKTLYLSGYLVIGSSILTSVVAAMI